MVSYLQRCQIRVHFIPLICSICHMESQITDTEHIIWKARPDSNEVGLKIGGRNINNLRFADDTILLAKSSHDLK